MRKNTSKLAQTYPFAFPFCLGTTSLCFLETRSQKADLCTLLRQAGPFGRQAVQSRLAISLGGTLKDIAMDVVILIEKHLMASTLKLVGVLGDATRLHLPPRQQKPRSGRISYLVISYTAFHEVKPFHFEAFEFILRIQAHKSCIVEVDPPKIPPTCFCWISHSCHPFSGSPSVMVLAKGLTSARMRIASAGPGVSQPTEMLEMEMWCFTIFLCWENYNHI